MYIQSIDLMGFKSFKRAHIEFSPKVNAIIGPNGSGKSNILDGILFALGETSLKRLRVDNSRKFIHPNHSKAEVILTLAEETSEGWKTHRIRKSVNTKGKITYEIDGRIVGLKDLKEFLAKRGIGDIRHAAIQQGEILKIVQMKPKERRKYIDELAQIVNFDMKKDEAMKELEAVGKRIDEANLLIGEKKKMLERLSKERDAAKKYKELVEEVRNLRGSILQKQVDDTTRVVERQKSSKEQINHEREELVKKMEALEKQLKDLSKKRIHLDEKLIEMREKDELFKEVEGLKKELALVEQDIEHISQSLREKREELSNIEKEMEEKIKALEEVQNELGSKERIKRLEEAEEVKSLANIDKKINDEEERLKAVIEELNEAKAELVKLEELAKREVKQDISEEEIKDELPALEREIEELRKEEKALNQRLIELDKKLMEKSQEFAELRAISTHVNAAQMLIEELKKSGAVKGIHGRVIDLIEFDTSLAEAIDGAGGGRLSYYVVEDVETARQIIKALRAQKAGRATFLPLSSIKSNAPKRGSAPLIVDLIRFNPLYEEIMNYVFGETVLAESFEKAKELKKSYQRVVTLDGTVFEKSGALSGGKSKGSVAMGKKAEEVKAELDSLKEEKRALLSRLDDIRQRMYGLRMKRREIEVKREKEKEMKEKLKILEEMRREAEEAKRQLPQIKAKVKELEDKKRAAEDRLRKLREERKQLEELIKEVIAEVSSEKEKVKAAERRAVELQRDLERLKAEKEEKLKLIDELERKERANRDKKNILMATITTKEEELSQKYKEIEGITKELQKIEQEMQSIGGERGTLERQINELDKKLHNIEVSLASLEERLRVAQEELEKIGSFQIIEKPLSHLQRELSEKERELASLKEIVNFAAEQAYEEYKKQVDELSEKLEKLKAEKKAVLDLIKEIEGKKRDAFMKAFESFRDSFKRMFQYIKGFGEGDLVLKNAENLSDAELHIKIRRDGRDIYLESLAGGEKTLVSLFFLFALNYVRPLPFYLFDEVDQALDKLNSERMIEFIRNLSNQSQFIIISHKDAVASKADALIGVAKQKGASTVVELRLPKAVSTSS